MMGTTTSSTPQPMASQAAATKSSKMPMVIALWGSSGHGKTNLLRTFVNGMFASTKRRARLYTAESAQMGPINECVRSGGLEVWAIDNAEFPFERINDAASGAWPIDVNDPICVGQPAFIYKYVAKCPECGVLLYNSEKPPSDGVQPMLRGCLKCKRQVRCKAERLINAANGIEQVGALLYEGGTEFSAMMMTNMAERTAKGAAMGGSSDKMGGEVGIRFQDGEQFIGASSQTHYGTAQRRMKEAIGVSKHNPVDYVIWTFGKESGEDEFRGKLPVFGPKLPGTAVTADVSRWFGPTLSAAMVQKPGNVQEYRLYVKPYVADWLPIFKDREHIVNNRIPTNRLNEPDGMGNKEVPQYYVVKPDDDTLLWRVVRMIELKQQGETLKLNDERVMGVVNGGAK